MVAKAPHDFSRDFVFEFLLYCIVEIHRDADDVKDFLKELGLAPPPGASLGVSQDILLDLGAYFRLRRWEAAGHTVHLDAGLPSAAMAKNHIVKMLTEAEVNPDGVSQAGLLARATFFVTITRFAQTARRYLGADLVLNIQGEDALVEELARFLWKYR